MSGESSGPEASPQEIVEAYLDAVRRQDMDLCVQFYAEDASIKFMGGEFRGPEAIAEWHRERFAAGVEILKTGNFKINGSTVTLDAVVTSNKLKAWRIGKLAGKATISINQGKIKGLTLAPRVYNPLAGW